MFARTLHSSQQLQEDIKLTVPSMGDSVSEGTVADFTKQPGMGSGADDCFWQCSPQQQQASADSDRSCAGDTVQEDDVIVQIETDKVTIDVRYTESAPGKIKEFLVKPEDTVTVGQEVAVIDKGAGGDGGDGESCLRQTFIHHTQLLGSEPWQRAARPAVQPTPDRSHGCVVYEGISAPP